MFLSSFKTRLAALTPLRRCALAFLLGTMTTLSLPPFGFFPVLLFTISGLIWLCRLTETNGNMFQTGWAFGCGYFIFGLYWISGALFVDIGAWGWVLPLSALLGPSVFAFYYGFIPLIVKRYKNNEIHYALAFIAAWTAIEWLRGHLFSGFPWNLPGYTWNLNLPVMQASAYIGIYGLTLLTLLWAALPVLWKNKKISYALIFIFAAVTAAGSLRLALHPTEKNGDTTVRIVQANISQSAKWDLQEDWKNIQKHAQLSRSEKPFTFVIWPETAVTTDLILMPDVTHYIAMMLPDKSLGLLGNLRVSRKEDSVEYFNSLGILDSDASVLGAYDKHHLVPFGEYIPFRHILNITPIAAAISRIGDFSAGPGPQTLSFNNTPSFSALICYEVIFPGDVTAPDHRPEWLVNVTNDGWYGKTAGPHQHFDIARVRAIEEGLPLARAANTGISAMIDPLGRVLAKKSLGEEGVVDSFLPKPLPPTFYSRFKDMPFFAMLAFLFVLTEALHRRTQ